MLSRITIRDLVIVRSLELDLGAGMSALTGETGAGKSILVDALGLALGDKADAGLIREGADRAEISVTFELAKDEPLVAWLSERDLDDAGHCLIRRVINRGGRSRAYVNGSPTPLSTLKAIGEHLVDIHGQHAHQSLTSSTTQRGLLDGYGQLEGPLQRTTACYEHWRRCREAYDALAERSADREARLDYLQFQLDELADLDCDPAAIAALEAEYDRLAHAEQLLRDSDRVLARLGDDEASVQTRLTEATQTLGELAGIDPRLAELRELVDNAIIHVDEAIGGLRHYQAEVELDPARLAEVAGQLSRLHELARKHRIRTDELGALHDTLRDEADKLANADSRLQALADERDAAEVAFRQAAEALSQARAAAASRLAETVTLSMQHLGMQGGEFMIALEQEGVRASAHGIDRISFQVAANPGQRPGPLSAVASGGELSRISLAIQVAAANCTRVPTLIFDEVDVGIGGATAEIVGQLLRRLGNERQVLCVTHLPQVASQAHHQMRVSKHSDGKATETRIEPLRDGERIDEIARMLGGVKVTEQTRRHADEMIRQARTGDGS